MNIIICKCGHKINDHVVGSGCINTDAVCQCLRSPQDIADDELAALKDAKHLLRTLRDYLNKAIEPVSGVGCEDEIGLIDSIDAYLELYAER